MNYWERWIGDWRRKTLHLSMAEKGAYGELLDHAYATEDPLPLNRVALGRITGATTPEEFAALDSVLSQFFVRTDDGYMNKRVIAEIEKRAAYIDKKRAAADARWQHHNEAPAPPKGNGQDKHPPANRGTTLNINDLPDLWRDFCRHERPNSDPDQIFYQFADHWQANANRREGKKADWFAAWRTWVRREKP